MIEMPNAEELCSRVLALPMHPYLEEKDMDEVLEKIRDFLNNCYAAMMENRM